MSSVFEKGQSSHLFGKLAVFALSRTPSHACSDIDIRYRNKCLWQTRVGYLPEGKAARVAGKIVCTKENYLISKSGGKRFD